MTVVEAVFIVGGGLVGTNLGFVVWWGKRVTERLDALSIHREECIRSFADKIENTENHSRQWKAIEGMEKKIGNHESRICTAEAQLKVGKR